MMRLAQSIYNVLKRHGVDTVFGLPGNHNVALYRDLPAAGLRHITARHEQGVGFMADGYARASGKVGVCFLISGPGLSNAATALAQAMADSVPLLVIATVGDQSSRSGALHELPDQLALAKSVCVEAVQAQDPEHALTWLQAALYAHKSQRPGPRYIQIPLSLWAMEVDHLPHEHPLQMPQPSIDQFRDAAQLMNQAHKPLLLLGGGSVAAGAEIAQLAERLKSPVLNTVNAKGTYTGDMAVGGSPSLPLARHLIAAADLLIVVASELGETDYNLLMTEDLQLDATLIRIDIDADQAQLNAQPTVALVGDAQDVLQGILAQSLGAHSNWCDMDDLAARKTGYRHMHEQFAAVFDCIDAALPDAVVVGDSTRPTYYASWMWERPAPRRYFHSVSGYGTLGYALPAAIGAKLAQPAQPTLAVIGDGGVMFSLAELAVAVHEAVSIKILIWDNQGYQEIAQSMAAQAIDTAVVQFASPDFAILAAGFGAAVSQPRDLQQLSMALKDPVTGPHVIWLREADFITEAAGEWY